MSSLQNKIADRTATVGVIGLGYVGLPLSQHFTDAGFDVVGFDVDEERVSRLRVGDSYVDDVDDDTLTETVARGFRPTADPAKLAGCDAFVLAVPTGVESGTPDMGAVRQATRTVAEYAPDRDVLFVCSSTVYPGAADEVIRPALENSGRIPGDDILVSVVPERLNPGGEYDFEEIPLVVGADSVRERETAQALFDSVVAETVPVGETITAESAKMIENTYRMVNIAFANQFAEFAENAGVDAWEAIDAAGTKPFGFQKFTPGPGVGGHCIPVDPQYLTWRAKQTGTGLSLVDNAIEVNEAVPSRVFGQIKTALSAHGTDLDDASVVVLGMSYKPNVGDIRNSPALDICELLINAGASIHPVDPHVDEAVIVDERYEPASAIDRGTLRSADIALFLVNHDKFDTDKIAEDSNLIFDAQNAVPEYNDTPVVRLGDGNSEVSSSSLKSPVSRR
ncbi:nucleotide sugar dehydrogenase [Halolamina salifodinae]|uniref:UDP-N-acetyl-D-mannosamine dehydrogenase n=1 Tax=Halolamina salifodinae TaxID=1202767 RepID=A0A8T4GXH3_9EURY|nr:nucleotide sugar dehydrogenase [Halolamina salifodinae]MBP1987791.1 nucleotide sugar dehydrogenase [Halolamina salifodinae]